MDDMYIPKSNKGLFAYFSGWVVALIGLFTIIGIVMAVGTWGLNWFAAPYQGKLQARQQIQGSGDFRIQAYNHFFDLCASVTTMDQALQASYQQLEGATGDDRTRIETNITAQLNDRNDAANQYNVDAEKSYTVGQFRANNLPYQVPAYTKGEVFTCATG